MESVLENNQHGLFHIKGCPALPVPKRPLLTSYMDLQEVNSSTIAKACLMLKEDLKKELSLNDIAKELCVGYETFRKQFSQEMQMSPDAYRQ